ncbi:ribosomal protein S18-alanine N-acetyltransferase [Streptococcus australis]|uniref:ribosomal protein S18-alanine N-acetyltransferase n=1 Tax=Streptococcus australis TaxID=113107 RepID=UPI001CBB55B6|nr:ribosomal protein S18-alanine N-acetyltransferase [Streptococcus australis]MBZ2154217.1 ribosomal protein S18-alanine N-acetyltransferase [Streptococcus australis]
MIRIEKEAGRLDLAPQLVEILDDVYGQSPWTLEQVLADLGQSQNWYAFAYSGEELVGFLAIQENLYELEVVQIAVRKEWQGRGIAGQLLESLPQEKEVFLEVREGNTPARTLYQKQGFKEIGCRKGYYHAPSEDAIIMKREANEG